MTTNISKENAFKQAYEKLNPEQKKAVDTIEGPVMVIAGPGTGKTQILTLRIANILLKTDTRPENILALTFTDSGAKAMRERLVGYIGTDAYRVGIFTFHSFAQNLIASYPDAYPKIIGGRPATDLEKIELIESILNSGEVENLRPGGNPKYYVKPLQSIISDLKREYITPDKLSQIIADDERSLDEIEMVHQKGAHKGKVRGEYRDKQKTIEKNRSLLYVYKCYEAGLVDSKLFDFDDMIIETIKALEESEDMLLDLQETYQYVLADEHQDVNGSQNKILELLASYHQSPNIFVVGDEKQAIFRFQGASLENFLYFDELFVGTKSISLTSNYRSGQNILDAAHSLVAVDDGPLKDLRIALNAAIVDSSKIEIREFPHQAVEDDWLVSEIKKQIDAGVAPRDVAVIVRSNREVESLTSALRRAGVSANASAESDILNHPVTHTIERLLELVVSTDSKALFTVMHGAYWGIDRIDLIKIFSSQRYDRDLWSIVTDQSYLKSLNLVNQEAVNHMVHTVESARQKNVTQAPQSVMSYLLEASGLKDFLVTQDSFDSTRVVRRLYDEVEEMVIKDKMVNLEGVVASFRQRREYNLPLNAPFIETEANAVSVMTAHKSKGLEFAIVFAPHLVDSSWGGQKTRQNFKINFATQLKDEKLDKLDDERRLLYVLLTRAKTNLYLSHSEQNAEGKELIPSRLFSEIDEQYLVSCETDSVESDFSPLSSLSLTPEVSPLEVEVIKKLFSERGFSATSLNNYLSSPWTFLYRNILRVPEVQPTHMQFGTAVHNVMQKVTAHHSKTGEVMSDTNIKSHLENELNRLPVGEQDYTRLHKKGFEALINYIKTYSSSWPQKTKEEFSIKVSMDTGLSELPHLPMTGNLDRLDLDEDGRVLRVVDYKTGKPKTRNHIEGNTKTSDGGYKRQLVFYALLLDLYDDDRYKCREGVLSFVEPDDKGVVHQETFIITDEEIADLKQEIISVCKEIVSGEFLRTDCDSQVCDYCHLVSLLEKQL